MRVVAQATGDFAGSRPLARIKRAGLRRYSANASRPARGTIGIVKRKAEHSRFVVCVRNRGFAASLELRKVYRVVPDSAAEGHRLMRVVDESGEDYLFPETCFMAIELPAPVARAIVA